MIDALIAGKLHSNPQQRTAKTGKPFTTAKVIAATSKGETLFVNVLAFSDSAQAALLALGAGDSVAVSGSADPTAWQDKDGNTRTGLDMIAAQVLTSYHVDKRRRAVTRQEHPQERQQGHGRPKDEAWQAMAPSGHQSHIGDGLDDGEPLPF